MRQKKGQNQKDWEETGRDRDKTEQGKTNRKKFERFHTGKDRAKKNNKKQERDRTENNIMEISKNEVIIFREEEESEVSCGLHDQ